MEKIESSSTQPNLFPRFTHSKRCLKMTPQKKTQFSCLKTTKSKDLLEAWSGDKEELRDKMLAKVKEVMNRCSEPWSKYE